MSTLPCETKYIIQILCNSNSYVIGARQQHEAAGALTKHCLSFLTTDFLSFVVCIVDLVSLKRQLPIGFISSAVWISLAHTSSPIIREYRSDHAVIEWSVICTVDRTSTIRQLNNWANLRYAYQNVQSWMVYYFVYYLLNCMLCADSLETGTSWQLCMTLMETVGTIRTTQKRTLFVRLVENYFGLLLFTY